MSDDTSGESVKQQSEEHNPTAQAVNPPASPDGPHPQIAEHVPSQDVQREVHEIGDRVKRAERWMIGLTAAIALSALGGVIVGVLQWSAMRRQLGEMKSGGIDTHALAVAAGKQAAAVGTQADRTKDLADRMKEQADRTKVIADQAVVQAKAAKSAAQTAIDTLHVSERAYVVIGTPQLDTDRKTIVLPVQNNGRIPSGKVEVVVHEATVDVPNLMTPSNLAAAAEIHWGRNKLQTIIPSVPFTIKIPIVKMNPERLKTGLQLIIVAGFVAYNDGFENSPAVRWPFCIQSIYQTVLKELALTQCDPVEYVPKLELVDGYPMNEQHNEPDNPN